MIMSSYQVTDLMNKDAERLKQALSTFTEDETVKINGPIICVKRSSENFPETYQLAVEVIKKELQEKANGRPYRVNSVKVVLLSDADQNLWDDYARHILEVTFFKV